MSAYYYSNQGGGGGGGGYKDGGRYYADQDTHVAMPPQGVTVTTERRSWNWCATAWASIASILCFWNVIFNLTALLCLSHSYTDHKVGDYERSRYKRNCGIGWLVTSWVLGILLIVLVIVLGYLSYDGSMDFGSNNVFQQIVDRLQLPAA